MPASDESKADRLERHRQAMAAVLGLDHLPAEWNAGVTGYLGMLADTAALYLDFPLDDGFDEPAPVFTPLAVTIDADGRST
jgi:hypothetical protein